MNTTFRLLFCSILVTLYGCLSTPKIDNMLIYKPKPVLVSGQILEFKEKAYWSHNSDGSYESADLINFKIVEPQKYRSKKITVYMLPFSKTKEELRTNGNVFNFEIDEEIFKDQSKSNSHTLFFLGQAKFKRETNEPNP